MSAPTALADQAATPPASQPVVAPADESAPLVLTPENTIILEGPGWSGELLQHLLLRYYVGPQAAQDYAPGAKVDRSASPAFPVFRDTPRLALPPGKAILSLGPTRLLSQADRDRLAQGDTPVLLRRQGSAVLAAGPAEEAIPELLNRVAGIRFYAPDELWTSRPAPGRPMTVGRLHLLRPRCFATSWLAPYWKRNADWVRMNPTAGRLTVSSNHNLANIFPPEKYGSTHPEIYELRGGQRRVPLSVGTKIWNPCLSAAALPDLAMEHIRATMKQRPSTRYISMGMMDIDFDCQCEACQASVRATGSYSTLYYTLLNEVARRCRKEFPGLLITSLLYSNARTPPVGIRIESNIVVKVVTKVYRFVDPSAWEAERARITAFSDLGASWMIHDWAFSGVSPRSYTRQYAAFLQWAHQHHMIGAYIEYSPGENWYLDGAKYWVLTQLLADPYQDVDLLWKQYCDDMFGPASQTMYRFFQHFQDKFVYAPQAITLADLPRQEPALYSGEDLAYQRSLLDRAAKESGGQELIRQRLAIVERYFRAHELFARATYEPNRLDRQFTGSGVNGPLLAFYACDDGLALQEAIRYYQTQRTIPPDDNYMDVRLGLPVSYVNNYTRGLAGLLGTIRRQALAGTDLGRLDAASASAVKDRARAILRENLPPKPLPQRVQTLEDILGKMLLIPTVPAGEGPTIDGEFSDACWQKGAVLDNFTERDTLAVPKHETAGRVLRVGNSLALALTCRQAGPVWAQSPKDTLTGTHIWRESGIEVFFGPAGGEGEAPPPFAQYVINALGAFRGFAAAKDNRDGVRVECRLDKEKSAYTIEALLPLKAGTYDYASLKAMTFNISRLIYTRDSYESDAILGWYPIFVTGSDAASRSLVFFP